MTTSRLFTLFSNSPHYPCYYDLQWQLFCQADTLTQLALASTCKTYRLFGYLYERNHRIVNDIRFNATIVPSLTEVSRPTTWLDIGLMGCKILQRITTKYRVAGPRDLDGIVFHASSLKLRVPQQLKRSRNISRLRSGAYLAGVEKNECGFMSFNTETWTTENAGFTARDFREIWLSLCRWRDGTFVSRSDAKQQFSTATITCNDKESEFTVWPTRICAAKQQSSD